MSSDDQSPKKAPERDQWFATTRWSVVLAAGAHDSPQAAEALEQLCRTYWYPLYAYVRRRGHEPEDAKDLTQAFFARLLEKHYLADVDPRRGKFRSFLLASLNHFLADEWGRAQAQKRGGGHTIISLDDASTEDRFRLEPVDELDAEKIFERRWTLTVLEQTTTRLRAEFVSADKVRQFEQLQEFLLGDKGSSYADAAAHLQMSEGAVRVAVHRMRLRFRELFREEIAHTVATEGEIEEEIQHMFAVLA